MHKRIILGLAAATGIRPTFFMSPDNGGEPGGGKPLSIEQQLAKAKGDLDAEKGKIAGLTKERDDARSEASALKGQFDAAASEAKSAKEKASGLETQISALTSQLGEANGNLAKSNENVARLETLCSVKGIDPKAAVPSTPESGASPHVLDQWKAASGAEKMALWMKSKAEIRAEAARREKTV